jgi:acetylornithine deacetylase
MRSLNEFEKRVIASCDVLFPEVVEFTRAMVGEYAVLGQEQGILRLVEERLTNLQMPVERVPMERAWLSRHALYAPVEWEHDDKYNLACRIAAGTPGRSLVLNGHLDVVPAEPADTWTRPPHVAWERDGWLYGRGAGDMQSGVAAMIYAVHAIRHAGLQLASPVTIQCVVEEECSGNGALACLERGYGGDFVLIPEPLGPQVHAAQVGVLWFKISARGLPVHVLETSCGTNAIEKLCELIPALKELEQDLNAADRLPPYDTLEHPFNFNIGKIIGGNWPSSVPGYANMECRIGYPPGTSAANIMEQVKSAIDGAVARDPKLWLEPPRLSFHGFRSDGHLVDLDHPGIRLLAECHESLTGKSIGQSIATATTDLRAFYFHSGIPGTCYGPIAQNIHGSDERVNVDSVRQTLQAYALFLSRWARVETRRLIES